MRTTRKLPSLANVAAGSTATVNCPVGMTYDKITLAYTGVTRAQLKNIDVLVNGKVIQTFTNGDELESINDYYGRSDTAGYLSIYFNRPELTNLSQQRLPGLGTLDVDTLQLRLDIDAGAAAPVIDAYAQLADPMPMGAIVKVRAFNSSYAASGEQEIDNLPKGPRVMAMHLFKSDVSNVDVEIDGRKVFQAPKALAEALQKEAGRAPVTASCTHVDFCLEGDLAQAIVTDGVKDFRIRPTVDTTGALKTVVEYLDGFQGI